MQNDKKKTYLNNQAKMQKFLSFIQKNPLLSKYGLGIVVLFAMIVSIRTYMNYLAIELSIQNVNQETVHITQRKLYEENFLIPYEQSEYSEYFLRHENNILFPGEFIVRFEEEKTLKPEDI
jgi:hypothetical protein